MLAVAGDPDSESSMTFLDHLEELRKALFRVGLVALVLIAASWALSAQLLESLIVMLAPGRRCSRLRPRKPSRRA
jgi:Sec-independent protein secretion pathway component TatC